MLNSITKWPKGTVSVTAMKSNDNFADISPIWKWNHVKNDFYTSRIIKTEDKIWFSRNGSLDCLFFSVRHGGDDDIYLELSFHAVLLKSFFLNDLAVQ